MRSKLGIGIDVGGSGIKGAVVDIATGALVTDRIRVPTPSDFGVAEVIDVIAEVVTDLEGKGPVGVGFPAVVTDGAPRTPPTAHGHPGWVGTDVGALLAERLDRPVRFLNDADSAGLAEMRFGAGVGSAGVVMLFTFGTGIGSAVFIDGRLVPNVELGHIYLRKEREVAEAQTAARVRSEQDLSWKEWGRRLHRYFTHIERVFTPDLIIVGGGASKRHERFLDEIDVRAQVVPAQLRNNAGIVGAAIAARTVEA